MLILDAKHTKWQIMLKCINYKINKDRNSGLPPRKRSFNVTSLTPVKIMVPSVEPLWQATQTLRSSSASVSAH